MTEQKRRRLTDEERDRIRALAVDQIAHPKVPEKLPWRDLAAAVDDWRQAREDVKRLRAALVDFGARLFAQVRVGDGESFADLMVIIDEMRALVAGVDS